MIALAKQTGNYCYFNHWCSSWRVNATWPLWPFLIGIPGTTSYTDLQLHVIVPEKILKLTIIIIIIILYCQWETLEWCRSVHNVMLLSSPLSSICTSITAPVFAEVFHHLLVIICITMTCLDHGPVAQFVRVSD